MALFDQTFKDEVRSKNDIVEVVSSYVKLERRGSRFVGLCPFHGEKTPSFHVIPHLQMYHCFGCKASGDVFKFVQEREHLTFYEAIVQLAKRARIPIPKEERTPEEEQAYRERRALFDALEFAARFYHNQLVTEPGKAGLDYLTGRGLTPETIRQFRLGWAPGYGRLYRAARARFDNETLQKAGLILPKRDGPGFVDAFYDRVMFPITDLQGRVIGFGGRILEGTGPKYKNTAETPVFSKRQVLFGLSQAKEAVRTKNQAILVEGYMDVIMPHQVGINNVVAPLGTALTPDQCKVLRQQAEQVIVAFDSDTAGQMATLRGLEILYDTGCDVRILHLPDGKDPDEYIRVHGVEGFRRCIDEAMPLIEFKLRLTVSRLPRHTPEGKAKALEAVARVLADLKNDVLREEYVQKVANELAQTPAEVPDLKRAIDRQMNRLLRDGFQHNQPDSRHNMRDSAPALPAPVVRPASDVLSRRSGNPLNVRATEHDLLWLSERRLVHLLLEWPWLINRLDTELGDAPFTNPEHRIILEAARAAYAGGSQGNGPIVARVLDTLHDPDARGVVAEMAAREIVTGDPQQEAADCIEKIKWHRDSRRITDLDNLMKAKQAAGEPVDAAILQEWIALQQKRKIGPKS